MPRTIDLDEIAPEEDEDGLFEPADSRPLGRRRRPLPWLRMSIFSGLCIAVLALLAEHDRTDQPPSAQPVPATVLTAPPAIWQSLNPANSAFGLDKGFGPVVTEARQHTSGGREDTLTLGAPGNLPYGRVTFSHRVPQPPRTFYLDLVRRAAEAGLAVERVAQTSLQPTKFGPVESAAVVLAGRGERYCQAFRFRDEDTAFGFQGWLCEAGTEPAPQRLTCFIDGLAVSAPESGLAALFARAEGNRAEKCQAEARTAAMGTKPKTAPGASASAMR